jgi:hypothetical protein
MDDINVRLKNKCKDWNEMLFATLTRNFGFGVNSDAFELLSGSLVYKYILKHRNNPLQVEAMFFGQAGLLDEKIDDPYFLLLRREYEFLRNKYRLRPVESFLFKKLRVRPVNFPHIRLAQLAALWTKHDLLFSKIIETESVKALRALFMVKPADYWLTRYTFRRPSKAKSKSLGKNAVDSILINTVIPTLFVYGKHTDQPAYCERAIRFLEEIAPEQNHIATLFRQYGVVPKNAGDTQALIQLRNEYCDKKKCLYCRIGFRVIGNS